MKQCLQLPSQTYSTTKRMKAKIEKRGLLQSVCRKEKTIFIPRIFKTKQKLQHLRLGEIIVKKNTECTQSSENTSTKGFQDMRGNQNF